MKKFIGVVVLTLALLMIGCGTQSREEAISNDLPLDDATDLSQTIIFPDYSDSKELEVNITLPKGWSFEKRTDTVFNWSKYPLIDMQSPFNIFNKQNENVGAIGFNTYKEYEGAEESPQAIYSGIAVGNNYNFNARTPDHGGYYTPIKETVGGICATTKVYYAPNISKDVGYGDEEIYNKGILLYDKYLLAYIAIEFDDNSLNDEDLKVIASSIILQEKSINS